MSNNIIAVNQKDCDYRLKKLKITRGKCCVVATVYDLCSDSDCDGCCTENSKNTGFLIDMEKYTQQRFGCGDGVVHWECLDC